MFPSEWNSSFRILSSMAFSWFLSELIRTINWFRWSSRSGLSRRTTSLNSKANYYSFKIFLRFWLSKITSIIHHNQLLLTKFGRILPYWTDDVKSAAKLHIIELLTEKNWGRVWVAFEVSNGEVSNCRTFYSFHGELLSKNMERTARRQLEGRHLLLGGNSHCMSQFWFFRDTAPLSPFSIQLFRHSFVLWATLPTILSRAKSTWTST